MAAADDKNTGTGNVAVTKVATHEHDRVAMLSVRADGTPDQVEPEFIGDKEGTLAATTEQFTQQAVSAADAEVRREVTATTVETSTVEDPTIAKFQKATEGAAKAGEAAAKAAVDKNPGADDK